LSSPPTPIKRIRPLLGTFVTLQVGGLPEAEAVWTIERGFAAIADVQRLMSFHDPASDLSALNRDASDRRVRVHRDTVQVIREALEISAESRGLFDITVAADLVQWGLLPRPASRHPPDPAASWQDVELIDDETIRFHRPLWLDLGGIAKGHAVDRAMHCLQRTPDLQCCVNAGGDLRVAGPESERIGLDSATRRRSALPVVDLANGSLASSTGRGNNYRHADRLVGVHVHGARRHPVGTRRRGNGRTPFCAATRRPPFCRTAGVTGAP
jgi:thiamine biosynthesis lipoprotein